MSGERKAIGALDAVLNNPLESVQSLEGLRIHHVGQGDALSVLGAGKQPVFHVDYGGRQSNPFKPKSQSVAKIDSKLPVSPGSTLMLSHWDEDHWCSALVGTHALANAYWLTPRQVTSPRAVARSTKMGAIRCIPEWLVGMTVKFEAVNGDAVWFEKLGRFVPGAAAEDCNETGVAFSITREATKEAILMPGDAPYQSVPHYRHLLDQGYRLRGLMAFHHGAPTHWEPSTDQLLNCWPRASGGQTVVFSYGDPNSYTHPYRGRYEMLLPYCDLIDMPAQPAGYYDILF